MRQWYAGRPGQGWFVSGPGDALPEPPQEEPPLAGTIIAFFYDEGGGPLWDEEGEIPNEPGWLGRELGLSEPLIADLLAWVEAQDRREPGPASEVEEQYEARLFERLRKEVKPGLKVVRSW